MTDTSMKILEKYKDLAKYTYIVLQQYPKSEKYTLAAHTKNMLWEMGTKLKMASVISNKDKKRILIEQADVTHARLDFLIEMGQELQFISVNKFGVFCAKSAEVGKMIGGWLNWAKKPPG